jgi:cobalt-zinc-cadmium efflux system outer membrane protein
MMKMQAQQGLTLRNVLQLAKKNNPDLKVLAQNINAAETDRVTAQLRPNPVFNMQTLHISRSQYRVEGTSWTNALNNQYWYQLTKPLQIAGLRTNKIALANRLVKQAQLDFNEASRNVYLSIASKYIDVWIAIENLNILLKGKKNIDSLVLLNEYRYKDQVITETDLFRVQLLQQQYQRDIVTGHQILMNESQNLKYLTGTTDSIIVVPHDPDFFNVDSYLDSLFKNAMLQRTDVLSARNNVEVSDINIQLQKSFAYPVPEVGGMYNPQNKVPYVGLYGTIEIPFFERNQGEREKARVLKYQAEQNLLATELQVKTEVLNAYRTYYTLRNNLKEYERSLVKAERILSNVRYSYLRGATSVIDLLEAERSWLDTQQRYYSAIENFRRSYVEFLYTSGSINNLAE